MYNLILMLTTIILSTLSGTILAIVLYEEPTINYKHVIVLVACILLVMLDVYLILKGEGKKHEQ